MKSIKFLLVALLLTLCGTIAQAQSVVVYKTDGTQVKYDASEVKDVKYQKVYYYYAGWTLPTSEEDLATLANTTEEDGNGVSYKAAEIGSSITGFTYDFSDDGKGLTNSSAANFYIVLPNGLGIYDNLGLSAHDDPEQFSSETASWNDKYTIYTSAQAWSTLDFYNIK